MSSMWGALVGQAVRGCQRSRPHSVGGPGGTGGMGVPEEPPSFLRPGPLLPLPPLQPPTELRGQPPAEPALPPAGARPWGAEACVLRGPRAPGHPRRLPLGQ